MNATTLDTLRERGFVPVLRLGNLTLLADFNADKSVVAENDNGKVTIHSPRSRRFTSLYVALVDKGETV